MNEIEKKVFARYPVKEKEKKCMDFRQRREGLRNWYRKQLLNEHSISNIKKTSSG
jgi:hypothetical protein